MFENKFIPVENVLIRKEIKETPFACDLKKCKGACCTLESEFGAPLLIEEVSEIQNVLPSVKSLLSEDHWKEIQQGGFYEKKDGELMTRAINNRACVFVYFENNIAKCSLEKIYFEGKSKFRKPISCHLFPIRISDFGGEILRYEKFSECTPALENGKEQNITIADFCSDALIRKYGKNWYKKLKESNG